MSIVDAATQDADIMDCDALSRAVTQRRDTCTVLTRGSIPLTNEGCPFVQWAYCGTSCPDGWARDCDAQGLNCLYVGGCTIGIPAQQTAQFDASQQLGTTRGLAVFVDSDDLTRCEFRACQ